MTTCCGNALLHDGLSILTLKSMKLHIVALLFASLLLKPIAGFGQSFDITNPGTQMVGIPFDLDLTDARDASDQLLNGEYFVGINGDFTDGNSIPFNAGDATITNIIVSVYPTATLNVTIYSGINKTESIVIDVVEDFSGFDFSLDPAANPVAGVPFDIVITNADDVYGDPLVGSPLVTISSDNTAEGSGGVLFSDNVSFTTGGATVSDANIFLTNASVQNLTVDIDGITDSESTNLTVDPAAASRLVITTQPVSVTGNYDDNAVGLTTINLETQDAYDNPSTVGLDAVQNVVAAISNNPGGATLGGTTTVDIQSGTASFSTLTIDEEGTGYTLNFASESPIALTPVISDAFNVTQLYNLSEFTIASPAPASTQYQNIDFQVDLTGAKDSEGNDLSGDVNVIVTSDTEGMVFNSNVNFSSGAGSFTLALANLGAHTLTVSVDGVDTDETVDLTVASDQSGFTLGDPGSPQYKNVPFNLSITNATGYDGASLDGNTTVTVVSNLSGTVYNASTSFSTGNATFSISIDSIDTHDLTVSVDGITSNEVITDLVVEGDDSDFTVAETSTSAQTAGVDSNIDITGALTIAGASLSGDHNVTVTSDISGEVFNDNVTFSGGNGNFTINLETAGTHTLTVAIDGITPTKTHEIVVSAATASQLVITQQPTGGNGVNNDAAVGIGTVTLETQDQYGNNSILDLSGAQEVSVAIQTDPSTGTATLGGTLTQSISTGIAAFNNLTLDRDGIEYTLRFSFSGSPGLTAVETEPFDMTNVEDQSGFQIVPPGPQVVGVEFNLQITNATDPQGNLLNTSKIVVVTRTDPTPTATIKNQEYLFTGGSTLIPITLTTAVEHTFLVTVDLSNETTISVVVAEDGSGMNLALNPAGTQTAGTAFDIDITNAMDATTDVLEGNHLVTIASSNTNEGTSGTLFSGNLSFLAGAASRSITLTEAITQDLYVTIDWVKDPDTIQDVNVVPNTATTFLITQQPAATVNGSNNDAALSIGTVILQTQDDWGNISTDGLVGATVDVIITGSPAGVTLGGTTTDVEISSGTASFDNLTLDKNGDYTLSFTYDGSAPTFDPNPVISNTISMTNVEDLSGFDVEAEPGTKYHGIPFDLLISNALDVTGTSLDGSVNVTVSSSIDGVGVYNSPTTFSAGTATAAIELTEGTHDLTVTISGVTDPVQITGLVVAADLSGFTLGLDPDGGPFYAYEPFVLEITGATDLDEASLDGDINVTVTSDRPDGEVHNATATFTGGAASIDLTLTDLETHTLTVDVDGVTNDETIDLDVEDNTSDFTLALETAGDKTAGTAFGLSVTDAVSLAEYSMTGDYNVTVTSNNTEEGTAGEIFNADVTFDAGAADFDVILFKAGLQTLTVEIDSITNPKDVEATVLAADASKLVITQQPTGGTGSQDDSQTSTGTVVVGTFDTYNNPSTAGMSGTQQVTVSIGTDASYNNYATLGGTTTLDISGGTATFSDLTLDQDGTGYTLSFSYSGDPALSAVESDAFDMTGVNAYVITLADDESNPINGQNPFVFADSTVGYDPITAEEITVTRTHEGVIQNLAAAISGTNPGSFTLTQPLLATLDDTDPSTTFTLKPNDGLDVGTYSATVTVTADNGVNEQFEVSFEVLAPAAISLDADDPTTFDTETEGYSQIADLTVTITNSGGGDITDLSVALSGNNPTEFVTSTPSPTTIASTETSTFTIRPANDLTPGTYNAVVTVNNEEGVPESFDVSFEVIAYTYLIDLDPSGNIDFGNVSEGYATAPDAATITITRTGTGTITNLATALSGSGSGSSNFEITQPGATTLDGSTNTTDFTVQPKTGLDAGTYTETVTVSADNMTDVTFDVTLRVSGNFTWTGSTNSDWHTAGNWSTSSVPDEFSFITISSSSNDPVVSSVNITVDNLVIENGAELTITSARRLTIASGGQLTIQPGGMLTSVGTLVNNAGESGLVIESDGTSSGSLIHNSSGVSATLERHMTPDTWHTLSSPVSGSIQSFILNPDNNIPDKEGTIFGMGPYDEGEVRWLYFTTATYGVNFTPGKSYITRKEAGADDFVTLAGTLNRGTYNISASHNEYGWNGIGNPYPSSIAFNSQTSLTNFIDVNADQFHPEYAAGYFWNGTGYDIINNTDGATYLQPGQGFIVKAKVGGGTFSFTTSQQAHNGGSASFYKKSTSPWDKMTLNVTTPDDTATTRMLFRDDMTRGLDITYDAGVFGRDTVFQLYTRLLEGSEVDFAIQCLPGIETDPMVIPVGLNYANGGLVTFTADIESLPSGYTAVLEDRSLGIFTDLTLNDAKYEVSLNEGTEGIGRFYLHAVADPTGFDMQIEKEIKAYAVRNEIYIKGEVSKDAKAHLFDIMGRKIGDFRLEPSDMNILRPEVQNGVYIIRIEDRGMITTERLYLGR
jgi:hypothetical protein